MASIEEAQTLELMLHRDVFPLIKGQVDPEVFQDKGYRALYRATQDGELVNGRVPPANVLIPYVKTKTPGLNQANLLGIKSVVDASRSMNGSVDIGQSVRSISMFLRRRYMLAMAQAVAEYRYDDASKFVDRIKKPISIGDSCVNPSSEEELIRIRDRDFPDGTNSSFKSSSSLVNRHLLNGGYKVGDLVMVVAPPKVGKSTFLSQEGASMLRLGFRVLHLAIGDMTEYDVTLKYISNLASTRMLDVMEDPIKHQRKCKDELNRLRIKSIPAMAVNTEQLLAYVRSIAVGFSFDCLIVDYDANISSKGESMYEAGGVLYSSLKGLADEQQAVVLVGSQPKQQYWMDEPLDAQSAAESSRKQQAVDVMITIAKNKECAGVGTLYLPLVRRGVSSQGTRVKFAYEFSQINEISPDEYDGLRADGGSLTINV